ncbi:hypothetical protein L1887_63511 [Cichorium endivia]|nr:hypothetical protein L1887_63511 [Cichorium endivia]
MAQNIVTVALLQDAAASTSAVLDALAGAFSLVERTTLRITLPDDDAMLRALLAHEIATLGEAAALVRWAPSFTAAPCTLLVLALTSNDDACKVFLTQHASSLDKFGPIYASPTRDVAQMQRTLLFPALVSGSSEAGRSSSASTRATSVSRASQPGFKARTVPSSVSSKPTIEPRLSRAAALRMGVPLPTRTPSPTKTPAPASGRAQTHGSTPLIPAHPHHRTAPQQGRPRSPEPTEPGSTIYSGRKGEESSRLFAHTGPQTRIALHVGRLDGAARYCATPDPGESEQAFYTPACGIAGQTAGCQAGRALAAFAFRMRRSVSPRPGLYKQTIVRVRPGGYGETHHKSHGKTRRGKDGGKQKRKGLSSQARQTMRANCSQRHASAKVGIRVVDGKAAQGEPTNRPGLD